MEEIHEDLAHEELVQAIKEAITGPLSKDMTYALYKVIQWHEISLEPELLINCDQASVKDRRFESGKRFAAHVAACFSTMSADQIHWGEIEWSNDIGVERYQLLINTITQQLLKSPRFKYIRWS